MDAAQEFVLQALKRQNSMNAVIDRFDSPVQQFYRGATVLVTGGSGFLGKQLIEKLFRSCEIKKLYLLLRSKKGRTIEGRLQTILKDSVFESLREKQPSFVDRIVAVEGDVTDIRLGLSDETWTKLNEEVNSIFHGAATVRFDAPLRTATLTNVRGTREVIALARACHNLKSLVHVSTAYSHATKDRVGKEVLEQFYETPISPDLMIAMAEELDEKKLHEMTESMIAGWPNTYTFTKAIAEELVRTTNELPLSVVRPPIVTISYTEPSPGWLDMNAIFGPSGIMLGSILGILRVFYVDPHNTNLPVTPVDYVNNCVIAAGWDAAEKRKRREKDIPVYTVSNAEKYLNWGRSNKILRKSITKYSSPKAVWYCKVFQVKIKFLYIVLSWLLHYIPAYIADAVCYVMGKKIKGVTSFVSVYSKVDTFTDIFHYFLSNKWIFKDDNVKAMCKRMNEADRAIYNCDVNDIDLDELCLLWALGVRKFIIKDGLEGSVPAAKKQEKFKIINYVALSLYFYCLFKIACFFFYVCMSMYGFIHTSNIVPHMEHGQNL